MTERPPAWPDPNSPAMLLAAELQRIIHPPMEPWVAQRAARMALSVINGGVDGPKIPHEHPDRLINCEFDLAPVFEALADVAEAAGWRKEEVATALVNLADNHTLGMIALEGDERGIAEAIARHKREGGDE